MTLQTLKLVRLLFECSGSVSGMLCSSPPWSDAECDGEEMKAGFSNLARVGDGDFNRRFLAEARVVVRLGDGVVNATAHCESSLRRRGGSWRRRRGGKLRRRRCTSSVHAVRRM